MKIIERGAYWCGIFLPWVRVEDGHLMTVSRYVELYGPEWMWK